MVRVSYVTNSSESENMRTAQPDKRTRLIETATKLAYGRGFRETSLSDIAEAARVPVGNVYYYFKTKEELAEAVVERRLEEFRTVGHEKYSRELAVHLFSAFQGMAAVALGTNDREVVVMEAKRLKDWIFFFNDTATNEIYTLALQDALPGW